jgi:signal transduction histidine kinase
MKWVHCRASAVAFWGKEAVLINMMDVTRVKELENTLRIQDKMSSLGRVAAGIAHEIRNPLSGINIYLNTLEKLVDKGEAPDKAKQIIHQIQSASGKIESVIRRVMDFSKPNEPEFVPTNLNKPIEEAVNLSKVTLRKRKIQLEKILASDMPPVRADPRLLEQVVLNLITNAAEAMKAMEGDKHIEICSAVEGDHVVVKISDSGPGVALHLRDKVFDPFYTTKNGSTGIGLSLCHRIITDHGGSMEISTSTWGGAEFKIMLPIQ